MHLIDVLLAYAVAFWIVRAVTDEEAAPRWITRALRWCAEVDFDLTMLAVPIGLVALLNWHPAFWVALAVFASATQVHHWCADRAPAAARLLRRALIPRGRWLPRAKELEAELALSEQRLRELGARLSELEHAQHELSSREMRAVADAEHWKGRALAAERAVAAVNSREMRAATNAEHWKGRALAAERAVAAVREVLGGDAKNPGGEVDATEKSVRTYDIRTSGGPHFGSHS